MSSIAKANSPMFSFLNKPDRPSIYHIHRFLFVRFGKSQAKGYKHNLLNNLKPSNGS